MKSLISHDVCENGICRKVHWTRQAFYGNLNVCTCIEMKAQVNTAAAAGKLPLCLRCPVSWLHSSQPQVTRPSRLIWEDRRCLLQQQDTVPAPVKSVDTSGEWSDVAVCGTMPCTVAWENGGTRTAPCSCRLQSLSGEWSHVAICGIMPCTVAREDGGTRTAPCSCR